MSEPVIIDPAADEARIGALREQIRAEREIRRRAEADAKHLRSLRLAVLAVQRDRDAGTSPALEQVRQRIEKLAARLVETRVKADYTVDRFSRIANPRARLGEELQAQMVAAIEDDRRMRQRPEHRRHPVGSHGAG